MSQKLPTWLKKKVVLNKDYYETVDLLRSLKLNTVCESAECPNIGECFAKRTATFMIMGEICTRNCRFCAVTHGCPESLETQEPTHIADAVKELGLKHVVITSVTRDDLPDGGASHFAAVIRAIRKVNPDTVIEVLTPDFKMDKAAIKVVVDARPDIFNHNVETVPRLYPTVRPQAIYERSLEVLAYVKSLDPTIYTKTGMMLGLSETEEEIVSVMADARRFDIDIFTMGQYLQPSADHVDVVDFIAPDVFKYYKGLAEDLGFGYVASGSFVRSSFHASEFSEIFM